jgi:RNAse (barnase) inhibitor barstar
MTAFTLEEEAEDRLDWRILRDGSISLYRNNQFLDDDVSWLRSNGYRIVSFDCANWSSSDLMHESLKGALSFPSYYGRNLDALNECMSEDLEVPEVGGLVLVLKHFDRYSNGHGAELKPSGRTEVEVVLDIFACASRRFLLTGRRLMTLAQSDDPRIHFEHLGGASTQWNRREWLNKSRGL